MLFVVLISASVEVCAQRVTEDAPPQFTQLFKVNLTDFAFGQYTAGYERVLNSSTTLGILVGGIGFYEESINSNFGARYDNSGFWEGTEAAVEAEVSGWELSPEVRRYGYIHDGMPEGLYVAGYLQLRSLRAEVDEEVDFLNQNLYGVDYQHEIDHDLRLFTFGAGINLGYQWIADNGLTIDAYFGPMFRSVNRSWDFDAVPEGQEIAEEAATDRMRESYSLRPVLYDMYNGRTGPWLRGGIQVALGF
jgi:hypothetical protein